MRRALSAVDAHYARHLGICQERHSFWEGKLVIEEFLDRPSTGAHTLSTRGVCDLVSPGSCHEHELICCFQSKFRALDFPTLMAAVVQQVIQSGEPLARGNVLGPAGPLSPGLEMEAFYVCPPVYFNDDFGKIQISEDRAVYVLWLIPIHHSEASWAKSHGFSAFESLLEREDPDLLDLRRPAIV